MHQSVTLFKKSKVVTDCGTCVYHQQILLPHLENLTEQQRLDLINLTQSCHQAEDALSQGMEKLNYILAQAISDGLLAEANYLPQIGAAMDKLEALVRFVIQVIFSFISSHFFFSLAIWVHEKTCGPIDQVSNRASSSID